MSPPLVWLHGWATGPGVFAGLVRPERGDVSACLPGYGGRPLSPAPSTAQALDQAVEAVAGQLPGGRSQRPLLVAWSLGALVALELARQQPERLAGLVLVAATPRFVAGPGWPQGMDAALFGNFSGRVLAAPEQAVTRFLALQCRGGEGERETLRQLRATCLLPAPEVLETGLRLLAEVDLRQGLAGVTTPVRIIAGGRDHIVAPAASQALAAGLAGAELRVIAKAAHAPFLSHRHEFMTLVEEFCP